MPAPVPYDRAAAVQYARQWAFLRNPRYGNFDGMGGDCTNFASQCLYAGCGVMNTTPTFGWYYFSYDNRAPAWSGVDFLYRFLTANRAAGPYARETGTELLQPGDLIQLGTADGHFYHTLVVLSAAGPEIFVATHTFDALNRPLSSYQYGMLRGLHIEGARR